MKRFSLVTAIFFSCVLNISAESVDWMPDSALRSVVREALELPAGVPLTKDHMQDLECGSIIERIVGSIPTWKA